MNRFFNKIGVSILLLAVLVACGAQSPAREQGSGPSASNGERIYFTASSDRGSPITYTGGPEAGMMMMGGGLTCASCHGPDGRGGQHIMHMEMMDAPDIRWSALASEMDGEHAGQPEGEPGHDSASGYDLKAFHLAVVEGKHPDATSLSTNMPRWNTSDEDLADLAEYLKSLP